MNNILFYDIEVYINFFCCMTLYEDKFHCLMLKDINKLKWDSNKFLFVGFNNRRYDHPIIEYARKGKAGTKQLFQMSKNIINGFRNEIVWNTNILDLLEICPKKAKGTDEKITCSLKEFGHRMGYPILQNLPYAFDKELNKKEMKDVIEYSKHDVNITKMLYENLKSEYETRQNLKKYFDIKTEYGGAPNLAQKCILSKLSGKVSYDDSLIKMDNLILSEEMKQCYNEAFDFPVKDYMEKLIPSFMGTKIINRLGETKNKPTEHLVNGLKIIFGRGGSHGIARPGYFKNVYEYDVTSYYPSIILNCNLGSSHFRKIYKKIYDMRLCLKAKKDPGSNSLKLVLNSIYGKFSDKYAKKEIYAPNLAFTISLLGQFYLIDLLEKLDNKPLVLNTDSILCEEPIKKEVLDEWEKRTGFKMECTEYSDYIIKNVNSVYGKTIDGKEKRKKDFLGCSWEHKSNPWVIPYAVINYFLHNDSIEKTIKKLANNKGSKDDIYPFLNFSKVKKGGKLLLNGKEIKDPKIRYYCSLEGDILQRLTYLNDEQERKARICASSPITLSMNLESPRQINVQWYIDKAQKIINEIEGKNERRRKNADSVCESREEDIS